MTDLKKLSVNLGNKILMKNWMPTISFIFLGLALLSSSGCSKKKAESLYTLEEFNHIMDSTGAEPDKEPTHAINFSDYSPGVNRVNSRPLIYNRLDFYVIEFENETQAENEAMRLNQYYSRNWLFDKVEGEPILEDLVLVKFHGKNPKRHTQRKPINIPAEHHGAPAASGGH